jgi:hypothetical protein
MYTKNFTVCSLKAQEESIKVGLATRQILFMHLPGEQNSRL